MCRGSSIKFRFRSLAMANVDVADIGGVDGGAAD